LTDFKLDENYPRVESNTRSTCSRSLGQNIEIAITLPRIVQFRQNLVEFDHVKVTADVQGQSSRSQRDVTYHQ